ncbi:EVE domain-containing protein [Mongoliitalea daihaiensis]|uniref:EVE domain-containing protein n=1 Tax=Mongoliitalea daihaiensis TaxID=2782006 RepID=UPI001F36A1C3|nr:EVE domain-containing protein [Mongoliitalea daihaiensis]UJP65330.1 EVE domain-containing protein [Mongoliitalea daihaiensis]
MQYWLVKSEPEEYSFQDLMGKEDDIWDGIRNYQARNFLKSMQMGDLMLFYHSGKEKAIVGVSKVVEEAFPDPKDEEGKGWVAVRLQGVKVFEFPFTLAMIKEDPACASLPLLKQSRLSVMPVEKEVFDHILAQAQ